MRLNRFDPNSIRVGTTGGGGGFPGGGGGKVGCGTIVIALIAAVFGFGGIAAGAVGIAKTLFFVFLILAVVSFIFNSAGVKG